MEQLEEIVLARNSIGMKPLVKYKYLEESPPPCKVSYLQTIVPDFIAGKNDENII
jgi:hypothetical protein